MPVLRFRRRLTLPLVGVLLGAFALAGTWGASALPAQETEPPRRQAERENNAGLREIRRGMQRASRWRRRDTPQSRAALAEPASQASLATLCVHVDGKHVALGCVVGSDGWALTKASALRGDVVCHLRDERSFPAQIMRTDGDHDLALLKFDAKDLPTLPLKPVANLQVGHWLATVGKGKDPIAIGVVSVMPRRIPHQKGRLGVELTDEAPQVVRVMRESGAEEAGVQVNDLIVDVDGHPTPSRAELIRTIGKHNPGDEIELLVQRDGKELHLKAVLSGDFPGMSSRMDFQNNLGGELSVRRFGFPSALQHDTVVRPNDCGGPVVNLDGQVVGINIARAGRTETYALTMDAVAPLVNDWLSELREE
ncbi:MAG: PDZ domain-containing protein [Planctomycetales bacterium]|nr:PDZ domain-containing protein [Planctomycetales bacterium]